MALAYSSAIQDDIASELFQNTFTNLTPAQKFRIDGGAWVSGAPTKGAAYQAWIKVQQMAQWTDLLGSDVTNVTAAAWFMQEICYLASFTLRPERTSDLRESRNDARQAYLDSIATIEIDDGYEAGVFTPTLAGIRFYILRHCVRLDKPVLVSPQTIDAAVQDRLNWLWNKANWSFRRRKLSAVIGVVNVTVGTWVESTKTLTDASTTSGTVTITNGTNPAQCTTSEPHGLVSGDTITIAGTDTTATTVGAFVVTVTAATTFTIAVNVSSGTDFVGTYTVPGAFRAYPYIGAGATTTIAGATLRASDGTSTAIGTYEVNTKASASAITLKQSLSQIAASLTAADITGNLVSVNVFGLQSGDRLDAIGTRELWIDGADRSCIKWATADELSALSAMSDTTTGQPEWFRIERQGSVLVWHFWPSPDQTYTVHFDGMLMLPGTTTPGVPTSATDTTVFDKFPNEFAVLIKDLALGKVLKDAGRGNEILKNAEEEVDRYAPNYDEPGKPTGGNDEMRDVYQDVFDQSGCNDIGGPM